MDIMTNCDIKMIAMKQSAIDLNCEVTDFLGDKNKVVISKLHEKRKKFITKPNFCRLVCYGNACVASVDQQIKDFVGKLIQNRLGFRCFEQLAALNSEFAKYGKEIGVEEFFLPDKNKIIRITPNFDVKIYDENEIRRLFYGDDRFHMALGYLPPDSERKDVIAAVAYNKNGEIMGMSGASNDSNTMWQVGIDVVPEFRQRGIGTTLVNIITNEILNDGIVPFYGTPWSHIASKNVAVSSGYKSAWVELCAYDAH